MSNLNSFFMKNAEQPKQIEGIVSNRFKDDEGKVVPFIFKAITPEKDAELQSKAIYKKPITQGPKKGQVEQDFDALKYQRLMTIESMVQPNLKDAELQNYYGVMGEVDLYNAMLLPGESIKAYELAQKANGYEHSMSDLVDEVKNS